MAHQNLISRLMEHISNQERINFARHLSIVIKAGLPMIEGLRVIRKQTAAPALGKVIESIIADIENGQFLADSLEKHENLFGGFFINIIRVGEASGTLAENLLYLSEELKKSEELKRKIRSAMIYPSIILVATLGVTALLTFVIFPKVLPIFTSLKVDLPFTTVALIAGINFLLHYGLWVLIGIIVLAVGWRLSLLSESVRYAADRLLFYVPVVSALTVNSNMASFTRVLAILLRSGIKIVEAITITGGTADNLVYRRALVSAADGIKRGEPLAKYLASRKDLFPPLLAGMVEIGENTGNLEENLKYLTAYYSDEVDASVKNLTTVLEPLLLLFMGLLVGFVALSIITPIYQVTQNIHP